MAVRVLVVDDSRFFRRRVTEILSADKNIQVIGAAENGQQAVEMAAKLKPDVITMDIEMPVMDGITAVRKIMATNPLPILMFSSLTTEGAKATLDALDAGAVDFLPKRFEDISQDKEEAKKLLCLRVFQIGSRQNILPNKARPAPPRPLGGVAPGMKTKESGKGVVRTNLPSGWLRNLNLVAIGASTGGPVALQEVLTKLPANFPLPIVLVQHMPATFTAAFAERMSRLCKISVREAKEGDVLAPGLALLAPGGVQMLVEKRGSQFVIRIKEAQPGQTYKPCVDLTFSSIAKIISGKVLAIMLTGMGADGREGTREMKRDKAMVWAQSEDTCVVWGMPGAVVEAGLADQVLPLSEIGPRLAQGV